MYKIVKGAEIVGLCDKPRYVKNNHGVYVQTDEQNADAVAIGGVAYPLNEITITEEESGEYAFENRKRLNQVEENAIAYEDATCELSDEMEQRIADIENALCELTEE